MIIVCATEHNIIDYIPQIIGVLGTILGTILGWLLHLFSNNIERLFMFVDTFEEKKSNQQEYAYIIKLFIYNASLKHQCLRNARVSFVKYGCKSLFESIPSKGGCDFETIRKNENKMNMISINSYDQGEYILSDLIDGEDYDKLSEVRKIYLVYEDKKNRTKKKLIKSNFKLSNVEIYKWNSFL